MRLVFAGTPAFAVPCLETCLRTEGARVVAVCTQPDRPAGRGRTLTESPVKQAALAAGVPVLQPESMKPRAVQEQLAALAPDLLVVVAYGLILPRAVLALPRQGCWNVHASLLPRWRGAAPIQRALAAGDTETGVCLMRMEAGLDSGPVLLRATTPITTEDTGGSLHERLAQLGARLLAQGLTRLRDGSLPVAQPQPAEGVTYAHKLDKAEALLDFGKPAVELARLVRAFDPWPVAEATIAGERVRLWRTLALPAAPTRGVAPGAVVATAAEGIDLATGAGVLRVLELQRPGGRRMHARIYLNGHPALRGPA
ncbi:MAG: methionyl-tRNA formyltransferase [Metallibacterium scheffleri]|nr:methionyl-tRNA formyltransferase [Metallibacterium scheffleri]